VKGLFTIIQFIPRPLRWLLMATGLWALGYQAVPQLVPLPTALLEPLPLGRVFVATDGTPLRHLLNAEGQRVGEEVHLDQIPEGFVQATLAAEDKRFFEHGGIDFLATARALLENAKAGRITSGASTITQQLIKISRGPQSRTLQAKLVEALQARHLELTWSKGRILAAYLSRLSYGNLFTGCNAAAQGYFRKPLSDLTPAECAFLAGLPQAPGRLNPFRKIEPVIQRQQWVLSRMRDLRWLDGDEYDMALSQRVRLQGYHGGFIAPHAIGLIEAEAPETGTVQTTIDAALQKQVESFVSNRLESLRAKHVNHAAVVVIENQTGAVRALAGSRDYFAADGGQINGAWAPRSPGSALKPFTYARAFEHGFTPASVIPDLPVEYQTDTGVYRPENYDLKSYGPMTCRMALGNSLNISAVRVLKDIGGAEALQTLLQTLGIRTLTEKPEHYGLGLTIGNAPVRLLELTNAYAALARLGEYRPWSLLANKPMPDNVRMIERDACWWLADILSDNQARVLTFGSRSPLRMPFKVAAKTGTSTSYRDNWTLGYTPEFTVGVWAGNFEGQPMDDVSGVTGAAPIFRDVLYWLNDRKPLTWYERPPHLVRVTVDPRNGKVIGAQSPAARMSREEWLQPSRLPRPTTNADYEPRTGRALLSPAYAEWVKSNNNWLSSLVTCVDDTNHLVAFRITQPTDGLIIRLDPDLPKAQQLVLQAVPSDEVVWQCDTLKIQRAGSQATALLKPGAHVIYASRLGERKRLRITVNAP